MEDVDEFFSDGCYEEVLTAAERRMMGYDPPLNQPLGETELEPELDPELEAMGHPFYNEKFHPASPPPITRFDHNPDIAPEGEEELQPATSIPDYIDENEDDTGRSSFIDVARRINFDNDNDIDVDHGNSGDHRRESAMASTSKSPTLSSSNKQSPLRSPLPEQQKNQPRQDQDDDLEEYPDHDDYDDHQDQQGHQDYGEYDPGAFDDGSYAHDEAPLSEELPSALLKPRAASPSDSPEPQSSSRSDSPSFQAQVIDNPARAKRRRVPSDEEDYEEVEDSPSLFIGEEEPTTEEATASQFSEFDDPSSSQYTNSSSSQSSRTHNRNRRSQQSQSSSYITTTYDTESLPSPPPDGIRRSRRTRIKPLAYWRNERIVYSKPSQVEDDIADTTLGRDILDLPLRSIKEVVHVPDSIALARNYKPRTKNRGRKRQNTIAVPLSPRPSEDELENDITGAEWIKQDSELKLTVIENGEPVEQIVAYNQDGIEFPTDNAVDDDVGGDEDQLQGQGQARGTRFSISILFNEDNDFCSVAMLEIPAGEVKAPVTMTTCNYVFTVNRGVIQVSLNNQLFIATKGCVFRIPNGNEYGFRNVGNGAAVLFFIQVRIPEEIEVEGGGAIQDSFVENT
ncbi:uncharacterized protein LODBEIA_P40420 [Lodderomyces beijingensis]|uniref:Mif2/CENP-C cupin domain-containing protein n=1 Tax=Lodderomyces beijingensis TaxID=1775926 RepID=A0ABP0ZNU7_9ASCO